MSKTKSKLSLDKDNLLFIGNSAFDGRWKLTSNHELVFKAEEDKSSIDNKLTLKGKITEAGADFITFEVKTKSEKNKQIVSFLKLKGLWRADKFNRLSFEVKRKRNPETLTFGGIWQLNKQQKIVYSYEKAKLKTKKRVKESIVFDGFWQINERNRLKYILSGGRGSVFNFKVQVESPNIYPKKGAIKYRLGIGVGDLKREKIISLYGRWNFSRKLGLSFIVDYGSGQLKKVYLGAKVKIAKNKDLVFSLRDVQDKSLGLALTFNHKLFTENELEYFIQIKKTHQDLYFGSGITLRF
ncbi:MAG: hypothetical protein K9L86_06075 [Candidatus Omnitrophica bacterium]|nr:hypothetical protein [Candidatus Omnitrophota bacterium]